MTDRKFRVLHRCPVSPHDDRAEDLLTKHRTVAFTRTDSDGSTTFCHVVAGPEAQPNHRVAGATDLDELFELDSLNVPAHGGAEIGGAALDILWNCILRLVLRRVRPQRLKLVQN